MNRESCACLLRLTEEEETYEERVKEWARAIMRADPEIAEGFVAAPIFPARPAFRPDCGQRCLEALELPGFR